MEQENNVKGTANPSFLTKLKDFASVPTRVDEVMTRKVMTLSPHNSCQDALALMAKHSFRHLIVLEENARLAGVVSDRDILRALTRKSDWDRTNVAEVMTREAVTVQPETSLSVAVREMLSRRINCLPVVENGRVCGIVTSTDLLSAFQQMQKCVE